MGESVEMEEFSLSWLLKFPIYYQIIAVESSEMLFRVKLTSNEIFSLDWYSTNW